MEFGFHTDVFNSSYWSFDHCLVRAHQNQLKPGLDGSYPLFFTPGVSKLP